VRPLCAVCQSNSALKSLDLTQNVMSPLFVQRTLSQLKARVRASFQRAPVMEGEGEEDEEATAIGN